MSDIGLTWILDEGGADFTVAGNDLVVDDGLETAVFLSLFTDRRAEDGDVLPTGEQDRRGWWGDAYPVVDGDRHGSRLWLLARAKDLPETLTRAEEYAREALAWLTEDRVAERVEVSAVRIYVLREAVLRLTVAIYRPRVDVVTYRYDYAWAAQAARRV